MSNRHGCREPIGGRVVRLGRDPCGRQWPHHSSIHLGRSYIYPSFRHSYPRTVYVQQPIETVVETYVPQPILNTVVEDEYLESWGEVAVPASTSAAMMPAPQSVPDEVLLLPMQQGDVAFALGDYAEARRHYIRAQLDGRFYGEATLAYGMTRFAEGSYLAAAISLRRGLEAIPDAIDYPPDLTAIYGPTNDDLAGQLDALASHLSEEPNDAHAWFVWGYVHLGLGEPATALQAFDQFVALAPQDALAHLLREAALTALAATPAPTYETDTPPEASPSMEAPVEADSVLPELL